MAWTSGHRKDLQSPPSRRAFLDAEEESGSPSFAVGLDRRHATAVELQIHKARCPKQKRSKGSAHQVRLRSQRKGAEDESRHAPAVKKSKSYGCQKKGAYKGCHDCPSKSPLLVITPAACSKWQGLHSAHESAVCPTKFATIAPARAPFK
eukprot:1147314-Pelagomonas_calceolata.AAC.4